MHEPAAPSRRSASHALGGVIFLAAGLAAFAQQPAAPPTKAIVPVAASTLAESPETYYGEHVSLVGAVERILSSTSFSVDQDRAKSTGKEVLILAPVLNGPPDLHSYVTVLGEVIRFDAAKFGRLALDLPPEVLAAFEGRPAVIARSVLTAAMIDLARKPPPPLSPEEQAYDAVMRRLGPAFTSLREAIAAADEELTLRHAAVVKAALDEALAFWKTRNTADAAGWAADGRAQAEGIERATAQGDWEAVKSSAGGLGRACSACHGAYRERLEDGTYRIKQNDAKLAAAAAR